MRGKLYRVDSLRGRVRITPAHAGKTASVLSIIGSTPDHPRACGENSPDPLPTEIEFGSPPRMRGKPTPETHAEYMKRITPAHAGKTARYRPPQVA